MGELVDTRFRIFDCPICISEERAAYNRIRLDFIKLANEAAEQYESKCTITTRMASHPRM